MEPFVLHVRTLITAMSKEDKMDVAQMSRYLNRIGTFKTAEGFEIEVTVTNVRSVFNRTDFEIRPRFGTGRAWVESKRVTIKKED